MCSSTARPRAAASSQTSMTPSPPMLSAPLESDAHDAPTIGATVNGGADAAAKAAAADLAVLWARQHLTPTPWLGVAGVSAWSLTLVCAFRLPTDDGDEDAAAEQLSSLQWVASTPPASSSASGGGPPAGVCCRESIYR